MTFETDDDSWDPGPITIPRKPGTSTVGPASRTSGTSGRLEFQDFQDFGDARSWDRARAIPRRLLRRTPWTSRSWLRSERCNLALPLVSGIKQTRRAKH